MWSIYDALRSGGYLFFAESLGASWLNLYASSWSQRFQRRDVTLHELCKVQAPYGTVYLQKTGVLTAFGTSKRQRRLLALVDSVVPFCPPQRRYVAYGYARK
jgi:hypothetical protein